MPEVVVQIVQHLRPGGIETMALDLQRFAWPSCDVHIVSLEGDKNESIAAWERLAPVRGRVHFLDKLPGFRLDTLFRLVRLLRSLSAAVVHTHHIGPLLYGGLAARLSGVSRLVHTEHDAWHLRIPRQRRLQKLLVGLVRPLLVADAETVAKELGESLPNMNFHVIPNGIDTERFTPGDKVAARRTLGLENEVLLIGCAARLEKVKGHEVLISALQRMANNVNLVLAGSGSRESELKELVRHLGLQDRVHFLGKVEAMQDFYRALDVFCLPSFREGMPLSPLEAQACDVPSVVSDVGGSRETLCPSTGEIFPAGDIRSLASALERQLAGPPRRSPRHHVLEMGDVRRMARAYTDLCGI